jgi:hypothetical protein
MSSMDIHSERGNGMLEMLLFTPLALMLLFVGTDTGVLLFDRAMIRDVIRESGHYQIADDSGDLFELSANGLQINENALLSRASRIGERMEAVLMERRFQPGTSESPFQVDVLPVVLSINTETGLVESWEVSAQGFSSQPGFSVLEYAPSTSVISPEEYLQSNLLGRRDSQYAVISPVFSSSESYLPQSVVFLISIEAVSPSISPGWQRMVLGSRSGIQLYQIRSVRN